MKPKKAKKQRPNMHTEFHLSKDACSALSNALLFMLSLEDFTFEQEKISYDSASNAQDKLFYEITDLTRGEVRAASKAIGLVLSKFTGPTDAFAYIEKDYPDLLSDLKAELPILADLQPVFDGAVRTLNKNK